ncbi:L-cysteine desulfhydrase-related protein [Skeletonema marinoi]|uniref:L-cysteine desulfhydrase-related protein n=1 Tax=Skeletonema marinoi TaxID=267567 RepID=A0AAD9D617_9STRA|nr:L-cysteine desulfhydrase-related protein [Skeletonema marinoi]
MIRCKLLHSPMPCRIIRTLSADGYKSIGSFHSDNVEELMRLSDEDYIAPELPFEKGSVKIPNRSPVAAPFANSGRFSDSYSHLDRSQWSFLNHGAFGLATDVGLSRAHSWRMCLESQPLRYFDRYLLNHLAHSARSLVDFVATENKDKMRESIALMSNVTGGMNAVIGGHARFLGNSSKVFSFDINYGSNKKMCQTYHGQENAIEIPFEEDFLPLLRKIQSSSNEDNDYHLQATDVFLSAFDSTIQNLIRGGKHSKSSLAGSLLLLDHITSNTAIHTPIMSLAKYAKEEYGMIVAVDGAHSLLSLPLEMSNILSDGSDGQEGVDIYLTNCHKWFSSPRGAAALFCSNTTIQDSILRQPAVVSHGVNDGFLSRFLWDGCRDYSAELSLPAITDFWNSADISVVRKDTKQNLKEGIRILIQHWHPGVCSGGGDNADMASIEQNSAEAGLTLVPLQLHAPMMALVRLPDHLSGSAVANKSDRKTSTDAKRVQDYFYSCRVEVPVKCVRGVLYCRVSCHVYNRAEDFETLARVALNVP